MKFKKKILAVTLASASLLALAACEDEATTYDVSFNTGDKGSYVATQTIEEGKTVTKPTNPTHEDGNEFVEWLYQGSAYSFSTEVTKDMELSASWSTNSYTVTFTTGYESEGLTVSSQSIGENANATMPDTDSVYRTGFEITGWTLNDAQYNFTQGVTENITLKAVWEAVSTYTVSLDTSTINETLDASITTQQVNEGRTVAFPTGTVTNADNATDILNGWMYYDSTNKTVVDFDTSSIVTSDLSLIPSWRKTFSATNYNYRVNLEDSESDWKVDADYSQQIQNPFSSTSGDNVIAITRAPSTGSSTSNSVNKFSTADREVGDKSIISFDVRAEEATNSALTIKLYANNSTSSSAEIARLKINGTSSTGGGANVQWGVYNSGGWNGGVASSFSFTNTSLNTNYRIQSDEWYTVQIMFEFIEINGSIELCAKVYLNGIHLSSSSLETNGYLTAVPSSNSIFENGATTNYITGINFSPDKQSSTDQAGNKIYINNLYVESI